MLQRHWLRDASDKVVKALFPDSAASVPKLWATPWRGDFIGCSQLLRNLSRVLYPCSC